MFREMGSELWRYRHLLWSLAWRDIRVRYKQSLLGIAWAMFVPVVMMLLFSLIFTKMLKIQFDDKDLNNLPYPIFAYIGLMPWNLFAAATKGGVSSLVANRGLVTKIYFPREVFPISSAISALVDFAIGSAVVVVLMIIFHTPARITAVFIPFVILIQLLFSIGISFFLSMGNLFYRDVKMLFDVLITLWMYATNVVYPLKTDNPTLQTLVNLNPMTPIISAYRTLLFKGTLDWGPFMYAAGVSVAVFSLGWIAFHRNEFVFAERI